MGLYQDRRSGRWGVDLRVPPTRNGKRVRFLVGTKAEAEIVLAQKVVERQRQQFPILKPPPGRVTFGALAQKFLADHPGSRRSNHYPKCIARLLPHLETIPIGEISRSDLDRLRLVLLKKVSPSTARMTLRALSRMFRIAVRWGMIDSSPAAGLEMPPSVRHRTRFLSPEEYRQVEIAAPIWLRPVLRLAVTTGMRLKEISLLSPGDIDWNAGVIHIPEDTKTGYRVVPISRVAEDALRAVLASDRPLGSDSARKRVSEATRRAMRKAGVSAVSFKTLRKCAGSWMIQARVPIYEVQKILGHSSPTLTAQVYADVLPEHLRPAVTTLDRALLAGGTVVGTGTPDAAPMRPDERRTRGPKGPPPAFPAARRLLTLREFGCYSLPATFKRSRSGARRCSTRRSKSWRRS